MLKRLILTYVLTYVPGRKLISHVKPEDQKVIILSLLGLVMITLKKGVLDWNLAPSTILEINFIVQ